MHLIGKRVGEVAVVIWGDLGWPPESEAGRPICGIIAKIDMCVSKNTEGPPDSLGLYSQKIVDINLLHRVPFFKNN